MILGALGFKCDDWKIFVGFLGVNSDELGNFSY